MPDEVETLPELVEVDELEVTPPVEVETPPVEVDTPPVLVETPPVDVETPPVVEVELIPPVLVETPPVVVELPPLEVDDELPPVEVELAIPPVVVLVTTTEPPLLLEPPKKPPKKPPPKPKPPLPPTITVWPPLPPSGIGCCGNCGIIGTAATAICGACWQVVVRVTTRVILRFLAGWTLATRTAALRFTTLGLVVWAERLACLTYCVWAAGASAMWTAPPPATAPPAVNNATFARAIRTDISSALFQPVRGRRILRPLAACTPR